jgi:hypothetical protein
MSQVDQVKPSVPGSGAPGGGPDAVVKAPRGKVAAAIAGLIPGRQPGRRLVSLSSAAQSDDRITGRPSHGRSFAHVSR